MRGRYPDPTAHGWICTAQTRPDSVVRPMRWLTSATTCNDAGTVRIAVQVSNAGSVEAPAGAVVRAYTWTALRGLREIASATIPEAIAPGRSAAAVELDVPVSEWGDRRVLDVVGSGAEACDWVNNREEIDVPDPCAEAR